MASFNKVLLMGNLTRDPEMRYLPNNSPVVNFGMAINRKFKDASGQDREDVVFVDVAAFAKTAELINQWYTKGDAIFVEGRLKLDQWEDKQGGGKRSKLSVVVDNLHFLPRGKDAGEGDSQTQERKPAAPASPPPARHQQGTRPPTRQPTTSPIGEQEQFKEDDIPF
jgi:single-strand DNA-binding protein